MMWDCCHKRLYINFVAAGKNLNILLTFSPACPLFGIAVGLCLGFSLGFCFSLCICTACLRFPLFPVIGR